jgi:hypothetical protein
VGKIFLNEYSVKGFSPFRISEKTATKNGLANAQVWQLNLSGFYYFFLPKTVFLT